ASLFGWKENFAQQVFIRLNPVRHCATCSHASEDSPDRHTFTAPSSRVNPREKSSSVVLINTLMNWLKPLSVTRARRETCRRRKLWLSGKALKGNGDCLIACAT